MALVDQMCDQCPPLVKDVHFDDMFTEIPYTEASLASKKPVFLGSTYNLEWVGNVDYRNNIAFLTISICECSFFHL